MEKLKKPFVIANILIVLLELIGTALSFRNGVSVLIWYTVESNILALIASMCLLVTFFICGSVPEWVKLLRYSATVCLAVTFLVVVLVLTPWAVPYGMVGDVLYKGPQIYHHILCPIYIIHLIRSSRKKQRNKAFSCTYRSSTDFPVWYGYYAAEHTSYHRGTISFPVRVSAAMVHVIVLVSFDTWTIVHSCSHCRMMVRKKNK